ncbi:MULTISPECIES: GUN4 domain-containing protein [Nostoc]|uniref:GUN4 domain-containing protein n=1 Tax=Nostoc paludosum FACHB-159 TaxID=2692908 RepID=A0ABR8KB32_9NOSO|nr:MULTISPECIES: GUN4 domain-containing protein [Nostoc]MBD2679725.1 GUN4 domain-containing protein [Nostoc sp. FACHB-857]MBD2736715.1 GUN4 domain-containing protein [Nostoc paludosum FACHB-159]
MPEESLRLFFSYSHKDEALRDELAKHLTILEWQGVISSWHDRKILPGEEWDHQINDNLNTADIILLLISSDFLFSKYCWDVEVKKAIERHNAREACVIPVILRSVDWSGAPFGKLQALPKNAEPVVSRNWHNQDEAFTDVARGIRAAAEKLKKERDEQQKQEAERLRLRKQEEENRKLQQEQERLRLLEQQQADRLKRQEAERLRRQQEQEQANKLQRQREQEKANKLRQQQQSTGKDLLSEKGVDYTRLRDLLKAENWKEADKETLAVMLKATGREQEGWLDYKSIDNFPCADLRTIDQLWVKYSDGHFGFSVQKRIWESVGKDYEKFAHRIGWRKGMFFNKNWLSYSDLTFTRNSPQGHLPAATGMDVGVGWLFGVVGRGGVEWLGGGFDGDGG